MYEDNYSLQTFVIKYWKHLRCISAGYLLNIQRYSERSLQGVMKAPMCCGVIEGCVLIGEFRMMG